MEGDQGDHSSARQNVSGDSILRNSLMDHKLFRVYLNKLPANASFEEVNKWISDVMALVGAQSGGPKLVTFFNFFCGISAPSGASLPSHDEDNDFFVPQHLLEERNSE